MRAFAISAAIAATITASASAGSHDAVRSIDLPVIRTELKAGEGREKVEALCNICHSLDYITLQPKFKRSQWTATVKKMVKVYGAPWSEDDEKVIIDYLVKNYGTGE